jgi:hypothetical protein
MDHVVPVLEGGSNTLDNLAICCLGCNQKKSALSFEEYLGMNPSLISKIAKLPYKPTSYRVLMSIRGIRARLCQTTIKL